MDFNLSDEHQSTRELAQKILSDLVDDDYHKRGLGDDDYDRSLWKVLGDAGLLGVMSSSDYGGIELGFLEFASLLEAQGSVLAPVPLYQSLVAAQVLERFSSAELCNALLPSMLSGDSHFALAFGEAAREELAEPLTAKDTCVSGVLNDVAFAKNAAAILVPVSIDGEHCLYALEPSDKAASLALQQASNLEPHYQITLDKLVLNNDRVLRGEDIVETTLQRAYTAIAALQLGVVEEALKRTAAYTMERQQFGKPLASFQAVSHRAADGYIDCSALRVSVLQAAWRLSENLECCTQARTAKWWASEAGHRVSHTAQHLHGGMGADVSYSIHRYFRWAKQLEFTLGGAQEQLAQTGRLLAGNSELGIVV